MCLGQFKVFTIRWLSVLSAISQTSPCDERFDICRCGHAWKLQRSIMVWKALFLSCCHQPMRSIMEWSAVILLSNLTSSSVLPDSSGLIASIDKLAAHRHQHREKAWHPSFRAVIQSQTGHIKVGELLRMGLRRDGREWMRSPSRFSR